MSLDAGNVRVRELAVIVTCIGPAVAPVKLTVQVMEVPAVAPRQVVGKFVAPCEYVTTVAQLAGLLLHGRFAPVITTVVLARLGLATLTVLGLMV